jgi:hypothetical protein
VGPRYEVVLDRWAWALAGAIAAAAILLALPSHAGPVAPGPVGQVALLVFYLLFVLVLPLAAVAGAMTPIWMITRRGRAARPRLHRVGISLLAAILWYWFLASHVVELP